MSVLQRLRFIASHRNKRINLVLLVDDALLPTLAYLLQVLFCLRYLRHLLVQLIQDRSESDGSGSYRTIARCKKSTLLFEVRHQQRLAHPIALQFGETHLQQKVCSVQCDDRSLVCCCRSLGNDEPRIMRLESNV